MARVIVTAKSDDFTISIPAAPAVNYSYTTIPITFTDIFFRNSIQQIVGLSQQNRGLIYRYKYAIQNCQGARLVNVDSAGNNLNFIVRLRRFIAGTNYGLRYLPIITTDEWTEINTEIFNPLYDDSTVLTTDAAANLLIDLRNADTAFDGITIAKLIITLDIEVN